MHLNYIPWHNHLLLKWSREKKETSKAVLGFLSRVIVCGVCVYVVTQIYHETTCAARRCVSGSLLFTLRWPQCPPGTAPTPFCERDSLPYGWRHWTSCPTLGDMCPGDRSTLPPPGLWHLCSVCAEAPRSPSGRYFRVHTKRKMTVKRILWLAYLLFDSQNSFPKEWLSSLFTQAEMTSWNAY